MRREETILNSLPCHGRVDCNKCFRGSHVEFDRTKREEGSWRITANPLAWGNQTPDIVLLGFSKGPTQSGALATQPHDSIAYKGSRKNVGKILAHVGLIPAASPENLSRAVDRLIADRNGRFHFGSLIRCTVERLEHKPGKEPAWTGTGGGMLDKFVETPFGKEVAGNCASRFLSHLPPSTRLVVMFGMGTKGNYIRASKKHFEEAAPGVWDDFNEVAYSNGKVFVVHVEHFASQGALIPNWLGENNHERAALGLAAKEAVKAALGT